MAVRDRYMKHRAEGVQASVALYWAKAKPCKHELDFDTRGVARVMAGGFDIAVKVEPDDISCSDLGYGTFCREGTKGAIKRSGGRVDRNEFTHYVPAWSYGQRRREAQMAGMARHEAHERAKAGVLEECRRAAKAEAFCIVVTASKRGIVLATDALGGNERSDNESLDRQVSDIVQDHGMIENVIAEARANLSALRETSQ